MNLSSLEDCISCPVKSDILCGLLHNRRKVSRSVSSHLEGLRAITWHLALFPPCCNLRCDVLGPLLQPGARNEEDTQLSCSRTTMGRTKKIRGGISDCSEELSRADLSMSTLELEETEAEKCSLNSLGPHKSSLLGSETGNLVPICP